MEGNKLYVSSNIIFNNKFINGGIQVQDGKIVKILNKTETLAHQSSKNVEVIDVGDYIIMPGLIDAHVHINEPGRTQWEGFRTATKAAAAGGITTIVDMPLNSIPVTTSVRSLEEKFKSAEGKLYVDMAFWGGLVPGNQDELIPMVNAGVVGFKCFMCNSGVDEFPPVNNKDIDLALQKLSNTDVVLAFHAEVDKNIEAKGDPTAYETFLKTRPSSAEVDAITNIISLAQNYNVRSHIVHLSSAEALPLIAEAKKNGMKLTVETCHHYLNFKSEDILQGATQFKCTPPIRDLRNQQLLWEAIGTGAIDLIASDHSPCTQDLKKLDTGNFLTAWGGISSLQFGLPLFWTQLKKHDLSIFNINKLMSQGPAKLLGLEGCKGAIEIGYDADFVIWDPHALIQIEESMIYHKNKLTPYLGKKLYGKVLKTIVRGQVVYDADHVLFNPTGKLIKKRQ